ncbi:MAG: ABC transporter permease [Planctomycetota bacterium]|jgi:peptide/nickel transport system permease protein|nr:ABC transporter permease [Planctomycetota bacterium]
MSDCVASLKEACLRLFGGLRRRKIVALGLAILLVMAFLALFADWVSPHSPSAIRAARRLRPPSAANWFGTDEYGRDVFTRVIHGGRTSLLIGAVTVVFSCFFGTLLGVVGGYFRRADMLVNRVIDAMMAFPDILLAITLMSVLRPSASSVVLALGIVYTPRVARVARASTLVVRELAYVDAARVLGTPTWRILLTHVLRNISSPLIVQGTFIYAYAILAEAGLSYLGAGVSPEIPTWGGIINAGQQYIGRAPWLMWFPGLFIALSVFSLQLSGDALRDALDPRLRKDTA